MFKYTSNKILLLLYRCDFKILVKIEIDLEYIYLLESLFILAINSDNRILYINYTNKKIVIETYSVIGLWFANSSGFRPIILVALCGWCQFLEFSGPEPSVYGDWLKISPFASFEIAQTTTCPDVLNFFLKKFCLDPFVFGTSFQGNKVHAPFPAVIAAVQPVFFHALESRISPAEEVAFAWNVNYTLPSYMLH